jgi:arylsulfatase A
MLTAMRCILPLFVLTGLVFASAASAQTPPGKPYNFIVIMADDLGAGELACYGNATHKTPNLDRLAREGMRFETCWATPLCTPTRVMLMTGQYATRTGYYNLFGRAMVPKPGTPLFDIGTKTTFADVVKDKGYVTALAGKWQLSGELPTLVRDCGFDRYMIWAYKEYLPAGVEHTGAWQRAGDVTSRYWNPSIIADGKYRPTKPDQYGPDLMCDYLIDFVKENRERPFLAYWPMLLTHGPHDPTPDLDNPGKRTETGLATNVRYMDHLVGKLVKALDEAGLGERTIVLFTGDNGTGGAGKGQLTEAGVRVPLIVRAPGTVPAGVTSDALVSLADVLPTIAELAEAKAPAGDAIDGRSFAGVIRGKQPKHRETLFSYFKDGRMMRDERYVLQGDGRMIDTTKGRDVPAAEDDAGAKAAREKFEGLLKDLPGPRPEQQLRGDGDAAGEEGGKAGRRAKRRAAKAAE